MREFQAVKNPDAMASSPAEPLTERSDTQSDMHSALLLPDERAESTAILAGLRLLKSLYYDNVPRNQGTL